MLNTNNKKSLFSLVATIVLVVILCVVMAGCSTKEEYYDIDTTYAMAQELGYTGTLDEFIDMISGRDGLDGRGIVDFRLASSNGGIDTYVISFSDGTSNSFTVKNGADGASVNQGYSAYEVWAQLPENTGKSVADFIAAISGKDGENGSSVTPIETATTYAIGSSASVVAGFSQSGYSATSRGSAVIYKEDTSNNRLYLITNYHVVYSSVLDNTSTDVKIYFYGMPYFSENGVMKGGIVAEYVGGSYTNDIAVLSLSGDSFDEYIAYRDKCGKVDGEDSAYFIRPVTPATKSAIAGETAIAIGNPAGAGISVTSGIVSVESESLSLSLSSTKAINTRVIRIDTAVNSGNSGGGLFNSDGKWIGIVNAKTNATTIENIAYAIPYELASAVADNILRGYERQLLDGDATNDSEPVSVMMPTLGVVTEIYDRYATVVDGKAVIRDQLKVSEIYQGEYLASALIQANDPNAILVGDVLVSATLGGQTYDLVRLHSLKELLYAIDTPQFLVLNVVRDGVNTTLNIQITASDIKAIG